MFSLPFNERVLQEARSQGLLGPAPQAQADPSRVQPGLWSSCLEGLLESGSLAPASLEAAAWAMVAREAGSWVDPVVPEAATHQALPELGDRFQQLTLLGEGATARVWRAWDSLLERAVAVKILKAEHSPVLAEARAQAQVEHPNVCRIYEVGQGYLVMELVEGPTLAQLAPELDQRAKLELMRELAIGVHAAHQRGLVHLDLKLNNILIQRTGDGQRRPIVSDFGMVRSGPPARSGCPMGTPPYTSPEQLAGDPAQLSPRSDIYALGVMIYVLLTGVIPFAAEDFPQLLKAMREAPPVPLRTRLPELGKDLERIVARCLEKAPQDRYFTAQQLAEELDRYLKHEPVEAMGGAWSYRLDQWTRRHRQLAWGLGLGALLLVGGSGVLVRHLTFAADQAEWDNHFLKRVEELRQHLDRAYRLPAHDLEGELAQARGYLASIRKEMAAQGRPAQAPGHLALGQALRLLNPDDPEALSEFRTAWNLGFHTESARTWLALALVQEFKKASSEAGMRPGQGKTDELRAAARKRYLEPARAMLMGRGNQDQVRLQHLVEVAQAQFQNPGKPEQLLKLAQDYRARFPNELDAILEEADQQVILIRAKAQQRKQTAKDELAPGAAVLAQWTQVNDLLLHAHRIAPSHPQVYQRLVGMGLEEGSSAQGRPGRAERLARAGQWLATGLGVSAHDPELWRLRSQYQVMVLRERLERGLDPAPAIRELCATFEQAVRHPNPALLEGVHNWQLMALKTAGTFGHSLPFALETLFTQTGVAGPQPEQRLPDAHWWWLNARHQLESGQDARFCLEVAARVKPQSRAWQASFQIELARAEYARLQGQDPAPFLAGAERAFTGHAQVSTELQWHLELRHQQALGLKTPQAWAALADALLRTEQAALPAHRTPFGGLAYLKGSLAVARHTLEQGQDPRPGLQKLQPWLASALAKTRYSKVELQESMAERLLLLGLASRNPRTFQEGLRACERALALYQPLTPAEFRQGLSRNPNAGTMLPPRKAPIHVLQGELLLALAEQDRARPWARKALDAFRSALQENRHLERGLQPLLSRARTLAGPGGGA